MGNNKKNSTLLLLSLITSFLFTHSLQAQTTAMSSPVVICGAANGNMAHSLIESEDHYTANVSFPTLATNDGTRILSVPLDHGDTFSDRIPFLIEKTNTITQIFESAENLVVAQRLSLQFEKNKCAIYKNNSHTVWYCENTNPMNLGGVNIELVEMSIESQIREHANGETLVYIGTLLFQVSGTETTRTAKYSTSYTYYTAESGTSCHEF